MLANKRGQTWAKIEGETLLLPTAIQRIASVVGRNILCGPHC